MHPAMVKLGGAVITDKSKPEHFLRAPTKRLMQELARADVPLVLLHGAGSFGHPQVQEHAIGNGVMTDAKRDGVSRTMASVMQLHVEVLSLAAEAGLCPVSVPLHMDVVSDHGELEGLPVERILRLLEEGFTPVLHGTLARDPEVGWRVVSADELMAALVEDLQPRLAVFVTDVDGVLDEEGGLIASVSTAEGIAQESSGTDVTGAMHGKVRNGLLVAQEAPTVILNGTVRGRLEDALRGKDVPCTHVRV